jgi:hypothetical protein
MAEHRSPGSLAPGVVSLRDLTTSAPGLRFAVRIPGEPGGGRHGAAAHEADAPHPLAGTGKLFLAVVVARLAEQDPGLLSTPLTIRGEHRAAARSGTLRHMTGDLRLTADDAMALIVGTGDGACTVALLGLLEEEGLDVMAQARQVVTDLGLGATTFTGLETAAHGQGQGEDQGQGDEGAGESWGEGLIGTTTPADLCTLLEHLVEAAGAEAEASAGFSDSSAGFSDASVDSRGGTGDAPETPEPPETPETRSGSLLKTAVADRVLAWMGKVFEPAGLASALPGFGPRTIPHRTVSGLELLTPPGAAGCASVLILPADVGTGRPAACVAAYQPRTLDDGSRVTSGEVGAVLGSLGLAVDVSRG